MIKLSVKQQNNDVIREIMNAGFNEITARVLYNRGCRTKRDAESFFDVSEEKYYSPLLLPDMEKAVKIIKAAIRDGKKITVFGDYDADGVTATTILWKFLKKSGADADYYIPHRLAEGYGINIPAIEKIAAEGTELIITVDNGTAAASEIAYGLSLGLDFVVTDHHECRDSNGNNYSLPNCPVVNPKRSDSEYPFRDLAGVGVAYKLICALTGKKTEPDYLGFTAIGTVADIMSLTDENRTIVSNGLRILTENTPVGIKALLEASNISVNTISASNIAFTISPRINAAGRMENADSAVKLLSTESLSEAEYLAEKLCEFNQQRQTMESEIFKEAEFKLKGRETDSILIEKDDNWHRGIIGIVASRLCEKYNRPCILLSADGDTLKGSGRSIEGLNIYNLLSEAVGDICKFGGHEMAAGVTIAIEKYDSFKENLLKCAAKYLNPNSDVKSIVAECLIKCSDVNTGTFDELTKIEPCGADNPQPIFELQDVAVTEIIPVSHGKYTKLTLSDGSTTITALDFGHTVTSLPVIENDRINIIGELNANTFRGERSVSVFARAIEATDSGFGSAEANELADSESEFNSLKETGTGISVSRNDVGDVYKTISKLYEDSEIKIHPVYLKKTLNNAGRKFTYAKIRICFDILSEVGLIKYSYLPNKNHSEGNVYLITSVNNTKTSLENSETYRKLKAEY